MPLDEHIQGGHGEREPSLKRRPAPMHHLLEVTDERQHREHRLHQHAVLPLTALTEFEIARIAFRGMEAGVVLSQVFIHAPLRYDLLLLSTVNSEGERGWRSASRERISPRTSFS